MIKNNTIFDVLIIGAGPAGMTAAIYCCRYGLKTAIIEKDTPGGKMVKTAFIENYPGFEKINGADLSFKFLNQVKKLNAEELYGSVISVKINEKTNIKEIVTKDNKIYFAKSIIIATGTEERKLNVPGEKEYEYRGVSYCAICDGPLYKDKDVAVIGGGDSAFSESLSLSMIVRKLYLIHRSEKFRAATTTVNLLKKQQNVEFHLNATIKEFLGDGNKIIGLIYVKDNKEYKLNVDCIFPYIGLDPTTQIFQNLGIVNSINKNIDVDENMVTNVPGIFSAGDVNKKPLRQIATAINDGAIAAASCQQYILKNFNS